MFTLKKLSKLPYKTRLRKLILILQKGEIELMQGKQIEWEHILSLLESVRDGIAPEGFPAAESPEAKLRFLNNMRHRMLSEVGSEPAEWDFLDQQSGELDGEKRQVFPFTVFLEDIRSPFNVGSIFRTAESFGVERILISPHTPLPSHKKATRTSRGADAVIPWMVQPLQELPSHIPVFALETGGSPIEEFAFPQTGLLLVGSEELGLSPEALKIADNSAGRVEIPLFGAKRSLNVSVAFGILMQYWCRSVR